ncbi:hypothetical protein LY76DRAFT_327952 [Colletotrichum caudatum]|nr:hypothetical protein LY76DRAFT_327952 [Colletotrichum caudatum]
MAEYLGMCINQDHLCGAGTRRNCLPRLAKPVLHYSGVLTVCGNYRELRHGQSARMLSKQASNLANRRPDQPGSVGQYRIRHGSRQRVRLGYATSGMATRRTWLREKETSGATGGLRVRIRSADLTRRASGEWRGRSRRRRSEHATTGTRLQDAFESRIKQGRARLASID